MIGAHPGQPFPSCPVSYPWVWFPSCDNPSVCPTSWLIASATNFSSFGPRLPENTKHGRSIDDLKVPTKAIPPSGPVSSAIHPSVGEMTHRTPQEVSAPPLNVSPATPGSSVVTSTSNGL